MNPLRLAQKRKRSGGIYSVNANSRVYGPGYSVVGWIYLSVLRFFQVGLFFTGFLTVAMPEDHAQGAYGLVDAAVIAVAEDDECG